MPSVANCNVPNKSRRKAQRQKVQKQRASAGVKKNARGTATSSVLYPTSGPGAALSSKKARKVEKARAHALKRAMEKEMERNGEATMTGMWMLRAAMIQRDEERVCEGDIFHRLG